MESSYAITAVYKFFEVSDPEALQQQLLSKGEELEMLGLILVAKEGLNGTVAGSKESTDAFKTYLTSLIGEATFKDSPADEIPFKRFMVKIRNEIVNIGDADMQPDGPNNHLSPTQWHDILSSDEDFVLLDARNDYETEIGVFKGAVDPKLEKFTDFPKYIEECDIPKDKKVLMYCTGGIRCEKASMEMQRQGYKHVYQLDGGILKYIEEYPEEFFEGECFVFDHRAAVDQKLESSTRYDLCPHCGDPGDQRMPCLECKADAVVCVRCMPEEEHRTCSKNCAYIFSMKRHKAQKQSA